MTSKSQPVNHLQNEFNQVAIWASDTKMNLNLKKTKEIIIQNRCQPPPESVKFENKLIEQVKLKKNIGIILKNNLSFKEHIEYTKKKCNSKIYLLRELKKLGYNRDELKYFYESSVLSTMLYGYTAWCSTHQNNMEPLVKIHKQAEAIIGHNLDDLQQCFNKKILNLFKSASSNKHPLAAVVPDYRSAVRTSDIIQICRSVIKPQKLN